MNDEDASTEVAPLAPLAPTRGRGAITNPTGRFERIAFYAHCAQHAAMPANLPFLPPAIDAYLAQVNNARQSAAEAMLQQHTQALPGTISPMEGARNQPLDVMRLSPGEAALLTMLASLLAQQQPSRPMRALDIGTFTGASAAALAQGMPHGGTVLTCDHVADYREIAAQYWQAAQVDGRISAHIMPATAMLQRLLQHEPHGSFDIAFIDADKQGYDDYYEKCLLLVRPGGMIVLDNMLWSGRAAEEHATGEAAMLRELAQKIAHDQRLASHVLLPLGDGIMLAFKAG